MITGEVKEELKQMLKHSLWKDLKIIELKIVPGVNESQSPRDSIEAILSKAYQPSQILRQQRLRKSVIRRYLWGYGIPVTQGQSKTDYIRICLNMWQVKDDDYLWVFLEDDEIDAELDRFQENIQNGLRELKNRIRVKRPTPNELKEIKRSMDKILLTITSVAVESTTSSSGEVIKPSPSSSSSSEWDSDSASSSSSVEIVARPAHFTESSSLDLSSSMHTAEPSSPQLPSGMDTTEYPSPQLPCGMDTTEYSSSPLKSSANVTDPASSQSLLATNISDSSPPRTPPPVQIIPKTPPSDHQASCTPRSSSSAGITKRQTSRTPRKYPDRINEPAAARELGQLIQTLMPAFYESPGKSKSSDPS